MEKTYELQGYVIVLDKVVFITRVFEAEGGEGFQFNIRFTGDLRLSSRIQRPAAGRARHLQ